MNLQLNEIELKNILKDFRVRAEEKEEQIFHPLAALSKNHSRNQDSREDYRPAYKSDVDAIVHSKAYSRYIDKTQVVYLVDNDHITHRSLHVQLVSNFARRIAEILRLNTDLVEAIALGHDVGHPPFGHEGELYLSSISKKYGNGHFCHPLQSCRLFSEIEPLHLGFTVYDGFLCHDGAMNQNIIRPHFDKTPGNHFEEKQAKLKNPNENLIPSTLEGCLVKLCDTMSYVGKDMEDAISIGILSREDIPKTILGNKNRDILKNLALDVLKESYNKDYIAVSDEVFEALKILRSFNFQKIYTHPKLKSESEKIKKGYSILFELLLEEHTIKPDQSYLQKNFLLNKSNAYFETTSEVQMTVDFISGMTDKFFIKTLENLLIPKNIKI